MIIFKILNPMTGAYTDATTEQERNQLLAQTAWDFYLLHTHGIPYSVVTVDENGVESWASPSGEPQLSPAEAEVLAAQWAAEVEPFNLTDIASHGQAVG